MCQRATVIAMTNRDGATEALQGRMGKVQPDAQSVTFGGHGVFAELPLDGGVDTRAPVSDIQ